MLQKVSFTIHTHFLNLNFCWYSLFSMERESECNFSMVSYSGDNKQFILHTESIIFRAIIWKHWLKNSLYNHPGYVKLTGLLKKLTEIFSFFSLSGSSPNSAPNFYENFGIDLVVCGMGYGIWDMGWGWSMVWWRSYRVHGVQTELSHRQDTTGNLGCP